MSAEDQPYILHHGDCLEVLRGMADCSVDSIVTDPPYGLSFMGRKWDYDVPSVEIWAECLRVLKPGGHLLAFAGTRTQHRMCARIEDAGFEIRDMIAWVYGSGFPKSLDVSKAIDKAAGAEREIVQQGERSASRPAVEDQSGGKAYRLAGDASVTAPATEAARQWCGWGTALKPALEPITMARKPLTGTVAANVQEWGTGGLNIDGSRVGSDAGRWPANLIHDGSDEVMSRFPDSNGSGPARKLKRGQRHEGDGWGMSDQAGDLRDAGTGSAARFFYCAKASAHDREAGNTHPTVKPTELMRYLCRLVTQPGGVVLDPFMGSGSTGKAAVLEGFSFIGIEREAEYVTTAMSRISAALESRPRQAELML